MTLVITGSLALVRPHGGAPDALTVENWMAGGEIGYTITGGEWRPTTLLGEKWEHYRWTGKFRRQGRTLQIGFMMGTGLSGPPTAEQILASAFEDAERVRWDTFESWAADMGHDPEDEADWKRARRIYNACERMGERLERFIPNDDTREQWAQALSELNR